MFLLRLLKKQLYETFCKILLIAIICVVGSTMEASAQKKRADKTSSAKAYYGQSPKKPQSHNYRNKSTKVKNARSQSAKRVRAQAWNRKKYS